MRDLINVCHGEGVNNYCKGCLYLTFPIERRPCKEINCKGVAEDEKGGLLI